MGTIYKFGSLDPEDHEWRYENVWAAEETAGGSRLVIACSQEQTHVLTALLKAMAGPFWVLYVLVVSRGRAEQGRYQSSEPQTESAVDKFVKRFSTLLENDGRHNLWIASESGSQMLVYDRHNVIYAYGPLAAFKLILAERGLMEVPVVRFPSPHSHHYHQGLDIDEDGLLSYWPWCRTPLKESDEE